ncbi:ABC-type lipoprotein export system, ATPase component [Rathayibacter oskolensis]|uniref:ABC-type lipoprotein export system, ATPase component n=1 Tax=Rathayibacter oskolensis TaxID=1891671 RepID=A0A1X7PGL1_9MICO|nr:ABC transporter ATP-binding protein [Rathayibacter oskolensis]SMH50439.1 ABC-type lipoprotein export system, ATPase component [Rathayibacter oskolensis]
MTPPAVLCSGLVRIFTTAGVEVQALQGLDLLVERGELLAIVGASGSGKSTLLGILSGLDTPTAGRVEVAGRDVLTLTERQRVDFRRRTVGFVWQQTARNLLPYLSVEENIRVVAAVARGPRRLRAQRVDEMVGLLGLGAVRDRRPVALSGGQQQRAAIAVALVNEPDVLLTDEPTGELDEAATVDVLEALRSINRENGVTTVIVTHDSGVSDHVSRTVRIRDGRTSTETLRRLSGGEQAAEEFAVLDRFGRLQLPEEFTGALGLRDRVRLGLEADHIRVESGREAGEPEPEAAPDAVVPDPPRRRGRHSLPEGDAS